MYGRTDVEGVEGAVGLMIGVSMKRRSIIVIGVVASAVAGGVPHLLAQSGGHAVSGQVIDAVTHDVVEGVRVVVKGTDLRGNSAADGAFYIENVPGQKVALEMSRAGYKSREIDITISSVPTRWTVALWKK